MLLAFSAQAVAGAVAEDGVPKVVVSVKPIHSLVAGVMAGIAKPKLLFDGPGSPHHRSLKPSEAAALGRARLVFWVGAGMERGLARSLPALARRARRMALGEAPGVRGLRQGQAADSHAAWDPHVWLDPGNAVAMARAAARALGELDPGHGDAYRANLSALIRRLGTLDRELTKLLEPVRSIPYLAYHDAYGHFARAYGLAAAGAVTRETERMPGARHLARLSRTVERRGIACLIAATPEPPPLLRTLAGSASARLGTADPLGVNLVAGSDSYFTLMHALGRAFRNCLAGTGG